MDGAPLQAATVAGYVPETWLGVTTTDATGRAVLKTADCSAGRARITVTAAGMVPTVRDPLP